MSKGALESFLNAGCSVYREGNLVKETTLGFSFTGTLSQLCLSHPDQEETELHAAGLEAPAPWPLGRGSQFPLISPVASPLGPSHRLPDQGCHITA